MSLPAFRRPCTTAATALVVLAAAAGAQPSLPLSTLDGTRVTFTFAQLDAMAKDTLRVTLHHDSARTYRVVALRDLLRQARVAVDSVRGGRTTWVLVATASDGYRSAFTLAELAEDLGPSRAFLAIRTTTGLLPADEAPYRLLVPTDKRQGRWARQVVALEVVDAAPRR